MSKPIAVIGPKHLSPSAVDKLKEENIESAVQKIDRCISEKRHDADLFFKWRLDNTANSHHKAERSHTLMIHSLQLHRNRAVRRTRNCPTSLDSRLYLPYVVDCLESKYPRKVNQIEKEAGEIISQLAPIDPVTGVPSGFPRLVTAVAAAVLVIRQFDRNVVYGHLASECKVGSASLGLEIQRILGKAPNLRTVLAQLARKELEAKQRTEVTELTQRIESSKKDAEKRRLKLEIEHQQKLASLDSRIADNRKEDLSRLRRMRRTHSREMAELEAAPSA